MLDWLQKKLGTLEKNDAQDLLDEAEALALYISRHGDVLNEGQSSFHADLLTGIGKFKKEQSAENWITLHEAYRQITAITYATKKVNGRTILDTQKKVNPFTSFLFFRSARHRPIVIGIVFFISAMGLELLAAWADGINTDDELCNWWLRLLYDVDRSLLTFLLPAVWGGIGACVFLMKRLSDKLFDQAYESSKVKGDMTRVFLGAMLGVVVVVLFFPEAAEVENLGSFTFGPASAAFIAGLSVKPVYAAFEAQSEKLTAYFTKKQEPQPPASAPPADIPEADQKDGKDKTT